MTEQFCPQKNKIGFVRFPEKNISEKDSKKKALKIGFVEEPGDENPFSGAKTIEDLDSVFDKMEKELRNNDKQVSKYQEEWNRLYGFYKDQHKKIRGKDKKRPIGFGP